MRGKDPFEQNARRCPGFLWDNARSAADNAWSTAAYLLRPEVIPLILNISQQYYGSLAGKSYPGSKIYDTFLPTFLSAAAPHVVTFAAMRNNISRHEENVSTRERGADCI